MVGSAIIPLHAELTVDEMETSDKTESQTTKGQIIGALFSHFAIISSYITDVRVSSAGKREYPTSVMEGPWIFCGYNICGRL